MNTGLKSRAKTYIKQFGEVTLSTFMDKMQLDEEDASALIWELVEEGVVEHTVGFLFRCLEGKDDKQKEKPTRKKQETQDQDPLDDVLDLDEDDEDWIDFDDEEEKLKSIQELREKFLSTPPICRAKKERPVDESEKGVLGEIATSLGNGKKFVKRGAEYHCRLDIAYPDETEMKFKLVKGDKILLSDCGRTFEYISKHYNTSEETVARKIEQIAYYYDVELKRQKKGFDFTIQIYDKDNAYMSFLWLFCAIEQIISMDL